MIRTFFANKSILGSLLVFASFPLFYSCGKIQTESSDAAFEGRACGSEIEYGSLQPFVSDGSGLDYEGGRVALKKRPDREFPNSRSSSGWIDMSQNVLLLHFEDYSSGYTKADVSVFPAEGKNSYVEFYDNPVLHGGDSGSFMVWFPFAVKFEGGQNVEVDPEEESLRLAIGVDGFAYFYSNRLNTGAPNGSHELLPSFDSILFAPFYSDLLTTNEFANYEGGQDFLPIASSLPHQVGIYYKTEDPDVAFATDGVKDRIFKVQWKDVFVRDFTFSLSYLFFNFASFFDIQNSFINSAYNFDMQLWIYEKDSSVEFRYGDNEGFGYFFNPGSKATMGIAGNTTNDVSDGISIYFDLDTGVPRRTVLPNFLSRLPPSNTVIRMENIVPPDFDTRNVVVDSAFGGAGTAEATGMGGTVLGPRSVDGGIMGQAGNFSAANEQYVNLSGLSGISNNSLYDVNKNLAFSLWFRINESQIYVRDDSESTRQDIEKMVLYSYGSGFEFGIQKSQDYPGEGVAAPDYRLYWQNHQLVSPNFLIHTVGNTPETQVTPNEWHHLVILNRVGSSVTFYVDGQYRANYVTPATAYTPNGGEDYWVALGARVTTAPYADRLFTGQMDEFAIWSRFLTEKEIKEIYKRQRLPYLTTVGQLDSCILDRNVGTSFFSSVKVSTPFPYGKPLNSEKREDSSFDYSDAQNGLMRGMLALLPFDGSGFAVHDIQVSEASGTSGLNVLPRDFESGILSYGEGKFGEAIYLDGVSDYVELTGDALSLTGRNSLGLSFWVKKKTSGQQGPFVEDARSGYVFGIGVAPCGKDEISFIRYNQTETRNCMGRFPQDTKWHHVVLSVGGTKVSVLIDGGKISASQDAMDRARRFLTYKPRDLFFNKSTSPVPDNTSGDGGVSTPVDPPVVGSLFLIGKQGTNFFAGAFDEFAFWNRALSEEEAQQLYLRGMGRVKVQLRYWSPKSHPGCATGKEAVPKCPHFQGPDGTSATYYEDLPGPHSATIRLANESGFAPRARFFQYRIRLETDDSDVTPQVQSITFQQ